MGCYEQQVLPRIVNATCGIGRLEPLRRRVCAGLAGDVAEIGFGSGLNVPFCPAAVTRVAAVEPSDLSWRPASPSPTSTSSTSPVPQGLGTARPASR